MEKWLEKYRKQFKEQFPLMMCRNLDESEIVEKIKACIDNNKPYAPELDENADY